MVVAAGGIYDGRGLAMALGLGAVGVWVGTRFICAEESSATKRHINGVLNCGIESTIRTTIYSGRPMRVLKNEKNLEWELTRYNEKIKIGKNGMTIANYILQEAEKTGEQLSYAKLYPLLLGQAASAIHDIKPAKDIVLEMVEDACKILKLNVGLISKL